MSKPRTNNFAVEVLKRPEERHIVVRDKVSAVVTVYNEEKNIKKCLESLKFADEIIVVDNSSKDKTVEFAKKYTKNIFSQKNNPQEIDLLKNFGFEKASNEWILSIDADEQVSPELASEIREILDHGSLVLEEQETGSKDQRSKNQDLKSIDGFWIPRKNIIFGKFIQNSGWYPDPQLRLFRKGKGKFVKAHVHEPIKLEGESEYLKNHIIHHHYNSIQEFLSRTVNLYAPNEAQEYIDRGYVFSYFDAIRFPLNEFLSRFFARKGYKDGFHGLILALLMAFYHFLIFAFIWEKKGFKEYDGKDFLKDTEKEFKKSGKEILYWLTKEKLESIKNPLKRNIKRFTEKLHNI
nr:glycosyltransferase family 2 protein [Candidatus Levybacteria bacterium]